MNTCSLCVTFTLLICGDIHPLQGPAVKRTIHTILASPVTAVRSKVVSCDMCEEWIHIKYGGVPVDIHSAVV